MVQLELMAKARRRPLWQPGDTTHAVAHEREAIERMIPHRDPLLLVDRIDSVDLEQRTLRAQRHVDPADPVMAGHFPEHPVYPGALLVEAMGQASLCLHHLLRRQSVDVASDDRPLPVRLLRIQEARFLAEVGPDDDVTILCRQLDDDSFMVTCLAQAMVGKKVCAVAMMDVFLVDEEA
jgi:3-hydroxyacyl-[acyl-carrier-protein] dehydratase